MKKENYIHPDSRLTFLKLAPRKKGQKKKAFYLCSCGNEKIILISEVKNGNTKSCGCFKKQSEKERFKTHGLTNHPLFNIWRSIINRCTNKKCENYKNYGGKGVTVCNEWLNDFKSFYNWCVENKWEKGMQIDKDIKSSQFNIDPPIYSPQTCSIVTCSENSNKTKSNVMLTLNGETLNVTQWANKLGIKRGMIYDRIDLGWPDEKILTHPKRLI